MSSDESPNVPAKRDRREAVREKAQQVHVKQSRLRVLRRVLLGAAGVVVVGGAAVAVTWALTSSGTRAQLQPATADQDGFAVTAVAGIASAGVDASIEGATASPAPAEASPTAAPTDAPAVDIRVYVDYLSTGARDFQLANATQLSKWIGQDAATLTYYPVAMLTSKSNGTKYSLRAASAAACVATHSPDAFFKYNDELLKQQPAVDSDGLTDEQLADIAGGSGVTSGKTVRECIENEEFAAWARAATDRALEGLPDTDGVTLTGTPMIFVNGVQYVGAVDDPKEFAQFVFASASNAYFNTPSPTPSASPSATPAS
jgi:protein-disulfide isomerase